MNVDWVEFNDLPFQSSLNAQFASPCKGACTWLDATLKRKRTGGQYVIAPVRTLPVKTAPSYACADAQMKVGANEMRNQCARSVHAIVHYLCPFPDRTRTTPNPRKSWSNSHPLEVKMNRRKHGFSSAHYQQKLESPSYLALRVKRKKLSVFDYHSYFGVNFFHNKVNTWNRRLLHKDKPCFLLF